MNGMIIPEIFIRMPVLLKMFGATILSTSFPLQRNIPLLKKLLHFQKKKSFVIWWKFFMKMELRSYWMSFTIIPQKEEKQDISTISKPWEKIFFISKPKKRTLPISPVVETASTAIILLPKK